MGVHLSWCLSWCIELEEKEKVGVAIWKTDEATTPKFPLSSHREGGILARSHRGSKLYYSPGKLFARFDETFPDLESLNASPKFQVAMEGFRVFVESLFGAGHTVGLPRLPDGK